MLRLLIVTIILSLSQVYAQEKSVQIEQIAELQKRDGRLVMVLIATDWCKYCQAMKNSIRKDKNIAAVLDRSFYTVFLNAENKKDILFGGKVFRYKATGINTGVHQLAQQLGTIDGRLTFPTLCFLNRKNEIVYQHAGFLDSKSLTKMLNTLLVNQ